LGALRYFGRSIDLVSQRRRIPSRFFVVASARHPRSAWIQHATEQSRARHDYGTSGVGVAWQRAPAPARGPLVPPRRDATSQPNAQPRKRSTRAGGLRKREKTTARTERGDGAPPRARAARPPSGACAAKPGRPPAVPAFFFPSGRHGAVGAGPGVPRSLEEPSASAITAPRARATGLACLLGRLPGARHLGRCGCRPRLGSHAARAAAATGARPCGLRGSASSREDVRFAPPPPAWYARVSRDSPASCMRYARGGFKFNRVRGSS